MAELVTMKRLAEIEARERAATEGPWHWQSCGEKSNDAVLGIACDMDGKCPPAGEIEESVFNEKAGEHDQTLEMVDEIAYRENDANYPDFNFIAHSRTDIPDLTHTLRRAVELLDMASCDCEVRCGICRERQAFLKEIDHA